MRLKPNSEKPRERDLIDHRQSIANRGRVTDDGARVVGMLGAEADAGVPA
jgi:hypothetical protein